MSSSPSPCSVATAADVRRVLFAAGASRVGFAAADATSDSDMLRSWIAAGCHADMLWMLRNSALRCDPRELLPGCRTVISCAFSYAAPGRSPLFAEFAQGDDYHEVLPKRLRPVAEAISAAFGADTRICTDSAPIRERFWAVRAGIGFCGLNGQLIVPGIGSRFFLAEILTTAYFEPDEPLSPDFIGCSRCGACLRACPGAALRGDGTLDCRRCLSYLTIEHRGPLPADTPRTPSIAGCDICQRVCPMNSAAAPAIPEFATRPAIAALSPAAVAGMSHQDYLDTFRGTPIRRIPYVRLTALASRLLESAD